jgi:hypothetical protein
MSENVTVDRKIAKILAFLQPHVDQATLRGVLRIYNGMASEADDEFDKENFDPVDGRSLVADDKAALASDSHPRNRTRSAFKARFPAAARIRAV